MKATNDGARAFSDHKALRESEHMHTWGLKIIGPRFSRAAAYLLCMLVCLAMTSASTWRHQEISRPIHIQYSGSSSSSPTLLILNSYHSGDELADKEVEGMLATLMQAFPDIAPSIEYLDAKRYPDEEHQLLFKEYLVQKYVACKTCTEGMFDLIFILDNPAFDLLLKYRDELFPGVPVVFAGVNNFQAQQLQGQEKITGVNEIQDAKGTLNLALRLHPKTKQALIIHDYTSSGLAVREEAEMIQAVFQGKLEFLYPPEAPFAQLLSQLKSLPPDAIVLIQSYATDSEGRTFTRDESTRLISAASPVPVYATHEARLGDGIMGGLLLDGTQHGAQAAEIALRILGGEDPAGIPVAASRSLPMFDHTQLARFGVDERLLPPGSTVINLPVSFWQVNRLVLIPSLAVIVVLSIVVVALSLAFIKARRAETARRQSQEKLTAILDNMFSAVYSMDAISFKLLQTNPAMSKIYGHPQADFYANPTLYVNMAHPEDLAIAKGLTEEIFKKGEGEWVYRILRPDGEARWVSNRARLVCDSHGKPLRVDCYILDITERKKAEEALRASEQKYRSLLEALQEGVWAIDAQACTSFVNPRLAGMLGYSAEEMLGKHLFDFMDEQGREIAAFNLERRRQGIQENHNFEFLRKDGNRIYTTLETSPLYDEQGGYAGAIAGVIDISQRKLAEEALRESEERYRLLVETSPDGIGMADLEGRLLVSNTQMAVLFGFTDAGSMAGISLFDLIAPEDKARARQSFATTISQGTLRDQTYQMVRKDGSLFTGEISAALQYDAAGKPSALIGVLRDISDRKRMQQRLMEDEKLAGIGVLAAGIAHEINTPLQIITGISETAQKHLQEAEKINTQYLSRKFENINSSAWRISAIVRSLLEYTLNSSDEMKPVALNEIVQKTLTLIEHQLKSWSNIEVNTELGKNLPLLACDPSLITQALINVISNARDAMPQGGRITIQTSFNTNTQLITLQVRDSGHGIPLEIRSRIFDPFFTTKPPGKGTGLGLHIVANIVRAHGGTVELEHSSAEGSMFTLSLPVNQAPQQVEKGNQHDRYRYASEG